MTATGEKFFRDEDGEWCADNTADDPDGLAREHEDVELRVIAGPALEWL
jgi:hypothetical protein